MDQHTVNTIVTSVKQDNKGHWHTLENSPFYAEGGGQPADRGSIGSHDVLDVQIENGEVWHLLSEGLSTGTPVAVRIDEDVRRDHSIQHTAQHLLTAILEDRHGIRTLSFGIGEEDSSIEIETAAMDWTQIEALEQEIQQLIFDNHPVHVYEIPDEKVDRPRLRKATNRTGMIRIVEIEGIDYNACGGTHVEMTGQLGMIQVTSLKKVRGNIRLTYVAGNRALKATQRAREALRTIHHTFSTTNETVAARVIEEHTIRLEREKEIKTLEERIAKAKVKAVLQEDNYVALHVGRTEAETLTTAIIERIAATGRIAVGANYSAQKLFVMHDGTHDIAVGTFLRAALQEMQIGRGGGNHKQAQARFTSVSELERGMEEIVRRLQEGGLPC
ncbi:alanyl-tRNA editing protein [Exiguobacterium aestuarii]|uniref:Alanyl-tRNA editing protein n=1 Tax=Exiguobacterium aestuarii TaxID=273527 RepID=A0ABW2PNB6_9BACL|nr:MULTISPECIES: alanyl-tRNA editing protein [Exiguobacterium]MCT4785297.1 alanyl-tRNA editing protein [Exiguobacterium aestuarii]